MAAAHHARERLEDLGLESFVKTTGGKGLHVVVPLARRHDWGEVKEFSRALALALAGDRPDEYTVNAAKRQRSQRIFIDYLRNAEGATSIAPYSVRARPGAPVATPLHWDEVGGRMKPEKYHVGNVVRRMQGLHTDPWKQLRRGGQTLTTSMKRKLGIET
jgi:bifunctional non-homologous end joining protein LigD